MGDLWAVSAMHIAASCCCCFRQWDSTTRTRCQNTSKQRKHWLKSRHVNRTALLIPALQECQPYEATALCHCQPYEATALCELRAV